MGARVHPKCVVSSVLLWSTHFPWSQMSLSAKSWAKHQIHINYLGKATLFQRTHFYRSTPAQNKHTKQETIFILTWTPFKAHLSFILWHQEEGPKRDMDRNRIFFLEKTIFFFFFIEWLGFIFIYLFILFYFFWLCWVFVSMRGLSLVAASGGHSS